MKYRFFVLFTALLLVLALIVQAGGGGGSPAPPPPPPNCGRCDLINPNGLVIKTVRGVGTCPGKEIENCCLTDPKCTDSSGKIIRQCGVPGQYKVSGTCSDGRTHTFNDVLVDPNSDQDHCLSIVTGTLDGNLHLERVWRQDSNNKCCGDEFNDLGTLAEGGISLCYGTTWWATKLNTVYATDYQWIKATDIDNFYKIKNIIKSG